MKWRCCATGMLALNLGWLAPLRSALGAELELRVLVIAVGSRAQDPAREAIEILLDSLGVPYETLDASQRDLSVDLLYQSATRGRFNGVILTDSETYLPSGRLGFDAAEFALLHEYERALGVREAILSGYPSTDATLGLDYGMGSVDAGIDVSGLWQSSAGGTEIFEYIQPDNALPTEDFAFLGRPRQDSEGPSVEPLLVSAESPEDTLISHLRYADGREVLLSTLNSASYYVHTSVLAYQFLDFATSGLFLGARRAYLAVHNDDLFLADEVWNPATRSNYPESVTSFRLGAADVEAAVEAQALLRERFPFADTLRIDFAFNGSGADVADDPLTAAIVENASEFGFINHTFEAIQMDRLCPDENSSDGCVRTDYQSAFLDIQRNAELWQTLGLPGAADADVALVSDSHSGLSDRQGTADPEDDIPYPAGLNDAFLSAAAALGIRTIAADTSRTNQSTIARIPGHDQVLLPRYPTSLFYNATTPAELVSEYNYIFHDRYLEDGVDPCTVPAALCEQRSYAQILDAEAEATLRHILSYQPFPHYFHQSNLRVYDSAGRTLQFDWLERVLSAYASRIDLPLQNRRFPELGALAWRKVLAQEAGASGWVDTATGSVTLSSAGEADIDVTGLAGGETYGGESLSTVHVSASPTVYTVDRALDR